MQRIKGFDGIRALCALAVLLGHAGIPQAWSTAEWWQRLYLTAFSHIQAVITFFVLSGYLISQLLAREKAANGRVAYGWFLVRRVLRLVPAYAVYLFVLAVLAATEVLNPHPLAFVAGLTYTYNYLPRTFGSPYTNHLWSLSLEEQFYLLYPLLLRWRGGARLPLTILVIIGLGVLLTQLIPAIPLPEWSFPYRGSSHSLSDFRLGELWSLKYWLVPAGLYCLVGCWFGLQRTDGPGSRWLLVAALVLYLHPWGYRIAFGGMSIVLQCVGLGCFLRYLQLRQESRLVYLLELGPLPFLGRISYGTYVWHGIFVTTGRGAWQYWWQGWPWGFLFTYATACLSYYFVERPFLVRKDRFRPAGLSSHHDKRKH
ncbi:MAG: acyltransferase [Bacteroidota bacterium]